MVDSYVRVRRLSGGTYTPGADWHPQFASPSASFAVPTRNGEIEVAASTAGTCADLCFFSLNPFEVSLWIEVPSSGRVQVQLNESLSEYTSSGSQSLSVREGLNVLRFLTASGAISVAGVLWGSDGSSAWVSSYPLGEDPFRSATSGVTDASASSASLAS